MMVTKYGLSPRGKKLVKLVRETTPEFEKIIKKDTYLRILSESSRNFTD